MPKPDHSERLPDELSVFLVRVFGSSRHLTAIETDAQRNVLRWYGEPEHFELDLVPGEPVEDALPVMLGYEDQRDLEVHNLEIVPGRPFDLFLIPLRDSDHSLIVMLDASEAVEQVQEIQQKANEIALLHYRQEQLMRDLDEARQRAEQASRLKTQFIAGMSHEFRTPLTAILGLSEILLRHPADSSSRVESIQRSANHLLALVENLLEHGRVESQDVRIDPVPVELQATLMGLHDMFEPLARQKGLGLRFEPHGEIPQAVRTDPVRLRQILVNLIANALRYTELGEVVVKWQHDSDQLRIEVRDTGPGIPLREQKRIFQPFAQLEGDRGKGGIGLGLSICRRMTEALGGDLTLQSVPGSGSTFGLNIPCVECEPPKVTDTGDRSLVLIVDDDEDIRDLLTVVLTDMGFRVGPVSTSSEALRMAENEEPGSILVDLNLGGEDGLDLIERLTTLPHNPRVIAMSAANDEHHRRAARGAGAAAFLVKPFDFGELEFELTSRTT